MEDIAIQEVIIYSEGCKMYGTMYTPSPKTIKKYPCVCIAPGGSGRIYTVPGGTYYGLEELAQELAKKGFITLTYDGRGQGLPPKRSEGKRTCHKDAQIDLHAALDFLSKYPSVDETRIGVFGQCAGGTAAAFESAQNNTKIKSLILWGTPPSFTRCLENGRLQEAMERCKERGTAYGESFEVLDAEDIIDKIAQPILIAGGSEDKKYFLIDEQRCLFERATKSKNIMILWVGRTPHRFSSAHSSFQALLEIFASWFLATL